MSSQYDCIRNKRSTIFSAYFVLFSLVIKPKIHFIRPKNFGIPHASPLLPRFTSKLLLRRLIYIDDNSVLRLPFVPSHPSLALFEIPLTSQKEL